MANILTLEAFMNVNGLNIQHSSEWEDYLEMNARQAGMTPEQWMAHYGSSYGISEGKVTRKQLDKALGALGDATKKLAEVLPKWKEARDSGDKQSEATYLEELRKHTEAKKAAEKLVNSHIQALDADAELKITEAKGFEFPKSFEIKKKIDYNAPGVPMKKLFKGLYKLKSDDGTKGTYWNQAFKSEVILDKDDFINFSRMGDQDGWGSGSYGIKVNEATEVTKEMWDKEWNIKKAFGKDFDEKFKKRIEAAMSKAKNEEQAEEWAYKNFKQLPNPAKGMTIEESVMNEATIEVDAMFPTDKEFLKFLKKNKVKIINKEMDGPAGHPVITMQGKRKDLEKVLADPELGFDDPDLAEYIEESVNEYGPMRGSSNRRYNDNDLVDRAAELDDIFQDSRNRRAIRDWEEYTEDLFGEYAGDQDGGTEDVYWADIPEDELQTAIDVGEDIMNRYKIKESVMNEAKGGPWPEQLKHGLTHWGYKKGTHTTELKTLSCRIGRNRDDYGGPNHAQEVADLNMKDPMVKKFFKPKFKVRPDGNYVNDYVELIPKKGYLYKLHVGTGQFEYHCLAIKPGEVYIFRKYDQAYGQYEYFQHEESMSTRSGVFDFKRHREEEQWKWNKLKPDSASHFVSVGWGIMDIGLEYTQLEFQFENLKTFESFQLNEKAPFPYNLGYNNRNDHWKYEKEIGMIVKDIEGIRDYHKEAQRGGKTAVRDISSRILITTIGQPEIKDAIIKALKGVDKNLDLKTIKNNYDASDRSRSKHEQDNDMWQWEIQKHEDVWSYKRKYGDAPKQDREFTHDHQMEFIDMLAPYSTTQHELANIQITSLEDFLQYAADHVSSTNLKKVTKRIKKEYPKLENNNTEKKKNLLTLESFISERRSNYSGDDEKIIAAIRDAAKEGFIIFSSGREMDGSTVEISVDSNNKNLPKGQFSLMPMDSGDYFKVGKLKKAAPKAIARMNDELEDSDSEYAVKMVGLEKREVIVQVVKKKDGKEDDGPESGSWWDNYSDEAKEKYIKKHGSEPDVGNKK